MSSASLKMLALSFAGVQGLHISSPVSAPAAKIEERSAAESLSLANPKYVECPHRIAYLSTHATAGDKWALMNLARHYELGHCVNKNLIKARELASRASASSQ